MIAVHVNLDPSGDVTQRRRLAEVQIGNITGFDGLAPHAYAYRIKEAASPFSAGFDVVGAIEGYDRNQPVIALLAAVLADFWSADKRALSLEFEDWVRGWDGNTT